MCIFFYFYMTYSCKEIKIERKMTKLDVSHIVQFRNADTGCCKTIPNGSIRERMLLVPSPHWAGPESIWESAHGLQGSSAGRYKQGMSELGDNILPFLFPCTSLTLASIYCSSSTLPVNFTVKKKERERRCKRGSRRPAVKIIATSVASMLPLL